MMDRSSLTRRTIHGRAVPTLSDGIDGPDDPERARRLEWSKLLKRTFAIDVLTCSRCLGRKQLVALIENERVARRILDHLGLPSRAPPRGAARGSARPPHRSLTERADEFDGLNPPFIVV